MNDTETSCPECGGSGYLYSDKGSYTYARRCPACKLNSPTPGVPKRYADASWDNWTDIPEVREAVKRIKSWTGTPWCILLHATKVNLGTGKTRILATACRAWLHRTQDVAFYLTAVEMIEAERISMRGEKWNEKCAANVATEPALVAIDDLGMEHDDKGGWAASILESCLDTRYSNNRPTIVATNLDLEALKTRYPRAWSRFHEGMILPWTAPDFRRK